MARALRPCGTEAAYQRHRYKGEEPCALCVRAHADDVLASAKARVARDREAGRRVRLRGGASGRSHRFGTGEWS